MIIFFLLTHPLISTLSFSYPTSITLNNGDILIVHKNGVTVTDSNCNQIKKEPVKFDSDYELITEDKLSTISLSKFTDGYIIGIINKRICFFTATGDLKKKNNGEISSSPILYFSLVPYKVDINYYHYFIVGYISGYSLNLNYYKFDPTETTTIKDIKYDNYKHKIYDQEISIQNKGIACEILKESDSKDILTCFYSLYYNNLNYLGIAYFTISDNSIDAKYPFKHYKEKFSLDCIKS
jgi:hypothetical protein